MNEYTYNFQNELLKLFKAYDFLLDNEYEFTRAEYSKALNEDCLKRLGRLKSFSSFAIPFSGEVFNKLRESFVTTGSEIQQNGTLGRFVIFQNGEFSYVFGIHSFEKDGTNVTYPVVIFADSLRGVYKAYDEIKEFEDESVLPFLKKPAGFV
jgi:hypothetical protein